MSTSAEIAMPDETETAVADAQAATPDHSMGQNQPAVAASDPVKAAGFLRSMLSNWATESVMVVSGFVLPRLINDHMGQDQLGIWDFGWLVRSYIDMSCSSLGSGAGYYVSRYRASGRWDELNRTLGAMLALAIYAALFGILITAAVVVWTPALVHTQSASLLAAARSLALSIGLASCIATPNLIFAGMLVGSRRFDLLNLVDGLCHVFVVVAVLACVIFGASLQTMGLCVLTREVINGVGRWLLARRVMPGLRIRPIWVDWEKFREIFSFSAKTVLDALSKFLQNQVSAVFLSSFVAPSAVAIFSRPRSLIMITTRFVMGFARVLVPRASALKEKQDQKGLGELLIQSTRYGLFLALPPALIMLILGHQILRIWMGSSDYADTMILPILVAGYLPLFAQQATYHVLLGVASHGLAGIASMIGAVLSAVLSFMFIVVFHMGVTGAALAMAIPVAIVNLFVLPYAGCKAAQVPPLRYLRESVVAPVLAALPFAAILLAGRYLLHFQKDWKTFLITMSTALPVLAAIYWRVALPVRMKTRLYRGLGIASPAAATVNM